MINNLQFIVNHHPWRAFAKHTLIIKSTSLRKSTLSAGVSIWPNPIFADDLLVVCSSLWNRLLLHCTCSPGYTSDSSYAHLNSISAVLCSGARFIYQKFWNKYHPNIYIYIYIYIIEIILLLKTLRLSYVPAVHLQAVEWLEYLLTSLRKKAKRLMCIFWDKATKVIHV